jgi:hypothetical protein
MTSSESYASSDDVPPVPAKYDYFSPQHMSSIPAFNASDMNKPLPDPPVDDAIVGSRLPNHMKSCRDVQFDDLIDPACIPTLEDQEKAHKESKHRRRHHNARSYVVAAVKIAVILPLLPIYLPAMAIRERHGNRKWVKREKQRADSSPCNRES